MEEEDSFTSQVPVLTFLIIANVVIDALFVYKFWTNNFSCIKVLTNIMSGRRIVSPCRCRC